MQEPPHYGYMPSWYTATMVAAPERSIAAAEISVDVRVVWVVAADVKTRSVTLTGLASLITGIKAGAGSNKIGIGAGITAWLAVSAAFLVFFTK